MKHKQTMLLVVIVMIVLIAIRLAPEVVEFKPLELQAITGLLGLLIFIALLLERFLDVFLTVSRAQVSESKFNTIMTLQARIRDHIAKKEQVSGELRKELTEARDALAAYKARTRQLSMWYGFAFGILVSCVGVRAIGSFAVPRSLDGLPAAQYYLFNLVDILLTGGLLAGGSDGIHKIAEVLRAFLEKNSKKYSEGSEPQPPEPAPPGQ